MPVARRRPDGKKPAFSDPRLEIGERKSLQRELFHRFSQGIAGKRVNFTTPPTFSWRLNCGPQDAHPGFCQNILSANDRENPMGGS
jgi:hypothetical protein